MIILVTLNIIMLVYFLFKSLKKFSCIIFILVGDFNVISIDWEKLAMWYDYFGAAKRTK